MDRAKPPMLVRNKWRRKAKKNVYERVLNKLLETHAKCNERLADTLTCIVSVLSRQKSVNKKVSFAPSQEGISFYFSQCCLVIVSYSYFIFP